MSERKLKPLGHYIKELNLTFGILLLIIFCTILIILSTFIKFDVTHYIIPSGIFSDTKLTYNDFLYTYKFIPQIPVILFVGAFLGRKYGIMSIILYILLGLFILPIFAVGGGLGYMLEYGFGYILAYIPAVFFTDTILTDGFSNKNIIKAVLVGVLTIHIIGILYMLFIAGLKHEGWNFVSGWIMSQSGIKILYDFAFSYATIFVAKYAKIIVWIFK